MKTTNFWSNKLFVDINYGFIQRRTLLKYFQVLFGIFNFLKLLPWYKI